MTITVTSIYMKEKHCQLEAAFNMVVGNTNKLQYNVCMAKHDKYGHHMQYNNSSHSQHNNRPKTTTIPSD